MKVVFHLVRWCFLSLLVNFDYQYAAVCIVNNHFIINYIKTVTKKI